MEIEKVEFMWKDDKSYTGSCPSISKVVKGPAGYVLVGKKTDPALRAQIPEVGDDEIVMFVPANVIDRIRDLP
jgi:hypothetical protein